MSTRMRLFAAVAMSVAGVATFGEAQATVATLPHPPAPSLSQIETQGRRSARLPRDRVKPISEADRKRLAALRTPDAADLEKYSQFLKQDHTGLVRLFPDADCVQKHVVRIDGPCASYVDGASGVSFRGRFAHFDLRFVRDELIADGFFSLALLTDIGDVELEPATLAMTGIESLSRFEPGTTIAEARSQANDALAGMELGGHLYRDRAKVSVGRTYLIRVTAFKPGNTEFQRFGRDRGGIKDVALYGKFLGLKYDDRSDTVTAFRIIRKDDDGSISILWKQLSRKKRSEIEISGRRIAKGHPLKTSEEREKV